MPIRLHKKGAGLTLRHADVMIVADMETMSLGILITLAGDMTSSRFPTLAVDLLPPLVRALRWDRSPIDKVQGAFLCK